MVLPPPAKMIVKFRRRGALRLLLTHPGVSFIQQISFALGDFAETIKEAVRLKGHAALKLRHLSGATSLPRIHERGEDQRDLRYFMLVPMLAIGSGDWSCST